RGEARRGVQGPVKTDLLIGNEWRASATRYCLTNPATEEPLAEVAEAGEAEVDAAVRAARACLESKEWRDLPARRRGLLLYRVADLLEQRSQEIAEVETRNNGKPLFESKIDVGQWIQREAAGTVKRVTLELGGKSPNIIFADADLPAAVRGAQSAIFYGKGEVCAAGSRLLVERSVHDQVVEQLAERAKKLVPGDPFDKNTRLGAIVSKRQQESVLSYIAAGSQDGARLVAGGKPAKVNGKGFYIEATVFDGAAPGMKIVDEEIFGPVLAVLTFENEAQGIELANRSRYGLAA